MSDAKDLLKPVQVDHDTLLKYHIGLTNRIDTEVAVRNHERALGEIKNPAVQQAHPHAAISHKEQQWKPNVNNENAAAKKKAITGNADIDSQLTQTEATKKTADMRRQIEAAASRKGEDSDISPALVPVGEVQKPATAASNGDTKPVAPPIPSWK